MCVEKVETGSGSLWSPVSRSRSGETRLSIPTKGVRRSEGQATQGVKSQKGNLLRLILFGSGRFLRLTHNSLRCVNGGAEPKGGAGPRTPAPRPQLEATFKPSDRPRKKVGSSKTLGDSALVVAGRSGDAVPCSTPRGPGASPTSGALGATGGAGLKKRAAGRAGRSRRRGSGPAGRLATLGRGRRPCRGPSVSDRDGAGRRRRAGEERGLVVICVEKYFSFV